MQKCRIYNDLHQDFKMVNGYEIFVYIFSVFSCYFNKKSIAVQATFVTTIKSFGRFIKIKTF